MAHTEWSADDVRLLNEVLPEGLTVFDLPSELLGLDPDSVAEFFREG